MPITVPSRELQVGLLGLESECLKTRAMLISCKTLRSPFVLVENCILHQPGSIISYNYIPKRTWVQEERHFSFSTRNFATLRRSGTTVAEYERVRQEYEALLRSPKRS
jgi:hypothetical protein